MPLPPELITTIENVADDQYLAVTKRADNQQEVCRNLFTFTPNLLIDLEPQWMLEKGVPHSEWESVKKSGDLSSYAAEQVKQLVPYGQRLYGFLFGDGVRLNTFLEFNDAYRQQLCLTLSIHANAAALWRLPWEYLHDGSDAQTGDFLALHGRFLLSRMPYGLAQLTPSTTPLPLRILVVISAPDDANPLNTEKEIGVIQTALDEVVRSGRVRVDYLDDATLENVGETLRRIQPHILHYTGHGFYSQQDKRSYLALERDDGTTHPANISDLRPYLMDAKELRLVILSGCQTAQTSDLDAFSGVATGLLQQEIAAVLAMQFSILDQSGITLARALYRELGQGATPSEAVRQARLALHNDDDGPGYDWGIPALYLRAQGMTLVDVDAPVPQDSSDRAALIDMAGMPLPPHFVGRKPELRTLRQALRDRHVNTVFVRGIGGMGKSSLAAKFLERPGSAVDSVLVLRCHELDPLEIPNKLAIFLQGQGKAGHAEAAQIILDSSRDFAERIRLAAQMIENQRYIFVFDNFETLMNENGTRINTDKENPRLSAPSASRISDPNLAELFKGLLQAQWRSLCVYTGRYPWQALGEYVRQQRAREIHLPQLGQRQAIMLMDNLRHLKRQDLKGKIWLLKKVGGHPHTLELLDGWLGSGRVTDLLDSPALDSLLAEQWEAYFLHDLLAELTPSQQEALTRLAIFRTPLDEDIITYANIDAPTLRRWLNLSLLQVERTGHSLHSVHSVVRDYLLNRLDEEARRSLHEWAAAYWGRPFVEMARRYAEQDAQGWSEEEIQSLARSAQGFVGQMVARTDDMAQARAAMVSALEWQHHLFAATAYDGTGEIVTAIIPVLHRWGQRDRAKTLLQASIDTQEGFYKAVAQGNLATLLTDEGRLDEALTTYQTVYETFADLDAKQQMAAVLGQSATIYQMKGDIDEAIMYEERRLKLVRAGQITEQEAISFHQLSILYRRKEEYATALTHSQEAETLARKLNIDHFISAILHEQGAIYNEMAGANDNASEGQRLRAAAADRFQQSLTLKQRTGNEADQADTLVELGKLLRNAGQMAEAVAAFSQALDIYTRQGNPTKAAITIGALGIIHEDQGQYAAALEKFEQALALFKQYSSPQDAADTERNIARVRTKMAGG